MPITVYQYPNCSTCKRALSWLDANNIAYRSVDIVKTPPSAAQLGKAIKQSNVPLKKFFNIAGESYRNGDFKTRLPTMSDKDAINALAADGKLIKRPLLVDDAGTVLVGFDADVWATALTA